MAHGNWKARTIVIDRRKDPFQETSDVPDPEEGELPGVDLQLGAPEELSGSGDEGLATLDEANMYGNDVIVDPDPDPDNEI